MTTKNNQKPADQTFAELVATLSKQMTALEHWLRPYVIVDLIPRHSVNFLYFRIRNVGQVPAYQIHLSVDPPISILDREALELNLFKRGISVLAPQDELSFFFNSALELFNDSETILQFRVTVNYAGPGGKNYVDEFMLDAELLQGLAVELPPFDKIVEQLERIKKEIEPLARYAHQLKAQEQLKDYASPQDIHKNVEEEQMQVQEPSAKVVKG